MTYVITAYKYGLRNNHSYVVGVTDCFDRAVVIANEEVEYRGGKYGVEVTKHCGKRLGEVVYYKESAYFGQLGHGGFAQPCDPKKIGWQLWKHTKD